MLVVSVITLDYKQWKPPVSYYLKKKDFTESDSQHQKKVKPGPQQKPRDHSNPEGQEAER